MYIVCILSVLLESHQQPEPKSLCLLTYFASKSDSDVIAYQAQLVLSGGRGLSLGNLGIDFTALQMADILHVSRLR